MWYKNIFLKLQTAPEADNTAVSYIARRILWVAHTNGLAVDNTKWTFNAMHFTVRYILGGYLIRTVQSVISCNFQV